MLATTLQHLPQILGAKFHFSITHGFEIESMTTGAADQRVNHFAIAAPADYMC